jgi:5'-deoxynucleotidase YfbR-like HD superfamily hydrolase
MGLSRISRWGGASRWHEPLSVAQHSLLVMRIREREEVLTPREALRELLHDASEGLIGWDPIGPLKPHLGEPFRKLEQRLQALVGERYALPAWDAAAYRRRTRRPIVSRPLAKPVTS